ETRGARRRTASDYRATPNSRGTTWADETPRQRGDTWCQTARIVRSFADDPPDRPVGSDTVHRLHVDPSGSSDVPKAQRIEDFDIRCARDVGVARPPRRRRGTSSRDRSDRAVLLRYDRAHYGLH